MTETEGTDDFDPLAYELGDRIGLCLDIDGTVYRSGSIFIETLAYLPYAEEVALSSAERRHRRTVLTAVADFHGGLVATTKWRGVLALLDALHVGGGSRLSETVLTTLARRRTDRPRGDTRTSRRPASPPNSDGYQSMRQTILSAYGRLLRGKRRTDVERVVTDLTERRCPVDPQLQRVIDRTLRETEADLYLVTDAPDHIATAYARKLHDDAHVVGTSYETDADGRYTGEFDVIDKGEAVAHLRTSREWEYVLAAGDSAVDVAMADAANLFLTVAGEGDIDSQFDSNDGISLHGSVRDVREGLRSNYGIVRVRRDEDLAPALETVLDAVGVLSVPSSR